MDEQIAASSVLLSSGCIAKLAPEMLLRLLE
jgi:hypothetical protein